MSEPVRSLGRELLYSTCWEDVAIAREALRIRAGGTVVAIGAAGDNVLALLLDDPGRVVAVDVSAAQMALLELKAAAIRLANLKASFDLAEFVGARAASFGTRARRREGYRRLRPLLSEGAAVFWDGHLSAIERGVLHAGRFERHVALFRRLVLPIVPGRRVLRAMLAARTIEEQRYIYRTRWNSLVWRLLFRIAFSRRLLSLLGRHPAFFRHARHVDVGTHFLGRTQLGLTATPIGSNPYVTFALTGAYRDPAAVPDYLQPANLPSLAARVGRIEPRCAALIDVLRELSDGSVDAFYLSDIFELADEREYLATLLEIERVGRPGARVCYWMNLVNHRSVGSLGPLADEPQLGERLLEVDRAFLYSSFVVAELREADGWRDRRHVA